MSKENQLTLEKMQEIMSEIKKSEITRVAFTNEQLQIFSKQRYTGNDETRNYSIIENLAE